MSWLALILIAFALAGIALWLNAQFNAREKALSIRENQLDEREASFKQYQVHQQANLNEQFAKALAHDNALKEQQEKLENHAKWLHEQKVRLRKVNDAMKAKMEAAYEERDSARQRAKRLQDELKTLKGKKNKSGDLITP